ncbi:hypothetical protein P3T36_000608 [Kitasatospora sp. MAP12-15]|nr:hypothetical protein [Kitasatospora sp. MAP12-44]
MNIRISEHSCKAAPTRPVADREPARKPVLHANLGGHTGAPWFEKEDGDRFFGRHLK